MSARNDGGFAFPAYDATPESVRGMTLRDYFAAKAMQGFMYLVAHNAHTPANSPEGLAAEAYRQADAMLKARSS